MGYVQHPIYGPWSSIYAKRPLEESVAWFGRICETRWLIDLLRRNEGPSREAFITSGSYEFLFWDMAYKQESWTILGNRLRIC